MNLLLKFSHIFDLYYAKDRCINLSLVNTKNTLNDNGMDAAEGVSFCGYGEVEREREWKIDRITLSGRGETKAGGGDLECVILLGRGEVNICGRDSLL